MCVHAAVSASWRPFMRDGSDIEHTTCSAAAGDKDSFEISVAKHAEATPKPWVNHLDRLKSLLPDRTDPYRSDSFSAVEWRALNEALLDGFGFPFDAERIPLPGGID